MDYAVAVDSKDDGYLHWTVLKLFDEDDWGHLLDVGLKVTAERWAEWQSRRGDLIVVPELPNLSLFAHIDEGPISFRDLTSLRHECVTVLSRVTDAHVRELLEGVIMATTVAEESNGVVTIFPAVSGEKEGDHFCTPV